ncbi:hypothetical protein RIF29_19312 [Crotalaria pallida]|uniref:Uncharacterized protein n=1 Tax=Crotalaria pallida TaxID=3830 RepID=A0AAN9I5E0_CROPI
MGDPPDTSVSKEDGWGYRTSRNCTVTPPQPTVQLPASEKEGPTTVTPDFSQPQGENQGGVLGQGNADVMTREINAEDDALHGDWLVVRRRKKGGKDKSREIRGEKFKEVSSQSLSGDGGHVFNGVQKGTNLGDSHLVGPSVADGGSRARVYVNEKKRARKEVNLVARVKDKGTLVKNIPLHGVGQHNVQLTGESSQNRVNSTSSEMTQKNQVSKQGPRKASLMKGFDLGTGIAISPDLLRCSMFLGKAEKVTKGKPPDPVRGKAIVLGSKGGVAPRVMLRCPRMRRLWKK